MSHEGRTPPHPGPHPALARTICEGCGETILPTDVVSGAMHAWCAGRARYTGRILTVLDGPGAPDWRHPGPRYLRPDTEWPERAECSF
jgi:hypothetical protein